MQRHADAAAQAVTWAAAHLSEREAVFARSDLLAAALAWKPGAVSVEAAGTAIDALQRDGKLHAAPGFHGGDGINHRFRARRRARDRAFHAGRPGAGGRC